MANQWAIAIGINNYRAFQSLNYAQQDAEAFCRHLIDSGITQPENCLLLTTASALHRGNSTFPERETIAQWLKGLVTGAMEADDTLILFFSGYGVHADGEDYLMPVDGDPANAAATGIAVKSIYRLLTQVPSGKVLIALDMNRNAGSLGEPAGAYSARIAQQASQQFPGMATLLSCKPPEEFSRESAGLRHGFFTAGILEVLRSRQRDQPGEFLDFKRFGQQLSDRMAELCEHYWRPVQTPVVIGKYSVPVGQTAASALVSDGVASSNGNIRNDGGANDEADDTANDWDWGNSIALGDRGSEPQSSNPQGSNPNAGRPADVNSSPSITSPTESILTPPDISAPVDVGEGVGDEFANTWPWSLEGEGQNGEGQSHLGSPGATSQGAEAQTSDSGNGVAPLDPYAAAWEEDFGDTIPFEANSEVVLNAQAQLERQEADLRNDSDLISGQASSNGSSGNGSSGNSTSASPELEGEPVRGGRPGHGGDGTDWHWADLSVAAATEDGPVDGFELDDDEGLDSAAANIFEYPEQNASAGAFPHGFPEPGPQGTGSAAGLAGAGLVVASRPGLGLESGENLTSLNPTQTGLNEIELDEEDPNWNWSGGEAAIDVEPHEGAGSVYGAQNGGSGDRPPQNEQIHSAATYEDVDADWPNNALDLDDDSEGLPIFELESEEFVPLLEQPSSLQSSSSWGWLSFRMIGCLGLTSLIALGFLGVFRGNRGEGLLPTIQSKFSLPSGFQWPGQSNDPLEDNSPGTGLLGTSEGPASGGPDGSNPSPSSTVTSPTSERDSNSSDNSGRTNGGIDSPGSSANSIPNLQAPEFSPGSAPSAGEIANGGIGNIGETAPVDDKLLDNELLNAAQQRIEEGQASSFNRAINLARQVPSSDPDYELARQSMNQWSQEVLKLSQQRAEEGEYLKAIATARLVPSDLAGFGEAQQSINQWQIPAQLEHAKAVIRPGQASSYNRAISIARNVPAGAPTHRQSQQLMQGWSNDIFEIAQQRANQNQWGLAIAAAQLVPPDMPAYGAAQSAIADWQPQLTKPK